MYPVRCSPRLKDYDYSQNGAYFVTICTKNREHLFGSIADGVMSFNTEGVIVQTCWENLPKHYGNMELDLFVVMPNHTHAIILIVDHSPKHGLSEVLRGFKTFSSRKINAYRRNPGVKIWQGISGRV